MTEKDQVTPSLEGYPVGAIFTLKTKGIKSETGQIYIENKDGEAVTIEELFQMADKGNLDGEYSIGVDKETERGFYSYAGTSDDCLLYTSLPFIKKRTIIILRFPHH